MKKVITILALALTTTVTFAQDTPLEITGSADLYYKYDFSENKENIKTSFATDQNSVSLGMIDIALKKKTGKTSFVGEVSFGPRGAGQSILDAGDNGQSFHIQNLYAAYAASDKLTLTAGYMGTFIGYEVISPLANLNYSTSYLFTNGPFQNAGVKANYAISSKIGLMVGLFNDGWNKYQADADLGLNNIGAQLTLTPVEGLTAYINYLSGSAKGTVLDLTGSYQVTEKFKLGFNVADFSGTKDGIVLTPAVEEVLARPALVSDGVTYFPAVTAVSAVPAIFGTEGYTGFALYPSYAFNDKFSLALRAENFKTKSESPTFSSVAAGKSVTAFTLSANLKSGGLTFIPEFRMDSGSEKMFEVDSISKLPTQKSASQVTLAVVYGF
jgi:hypothetical protein